MENGFTIRLISLIVVLAGVAAAQTGPPEGSVQGVPPGLIAEPIKPTPARSAPPRKDIPAIAKGANGSVVSIVMSDKGGKPIAQGSGFLVSRDGTILTNYHVIAEGASAIVKLPNGAFYVVDGVLASDKDRDVAIIQAHGQDFKTVTLGNSDRVQVGEQIVAIGNPLSLESTVSNGIVSAIRTIDDEGGKFLQVTAPISPGSSGGPLFNMAGEVVGITTLKFKGGENLNFAIPINDAKRLLLLRSSMLHALPIEVGKDSLKEAHAESSGEPPLVGGMMESPAYRQYQELLTANDLTMRTGVYACFYDSKESPNFFVINVSLASKHYMQALVEKFKDGVLDDSPLIFGGKLQPFSSKQAIFAELPTSYDYKNDSDKSHETDVFKWLSGDIAIEEGFGKLSPGQARLGYKLKIQHSTGRFAEDTIFNTGEEPEGFTIHETGKCIRIPNIVLTPEEQYEFVDN